MSEEAGPERLSDSAILAANRIACFSVCLTVTASTGFLLEISDVGVVAQNFIISVCQSGQTRPV